MPGSGREEEKWRKKGRREEMVGKNGSKRWKDCLSFLPTHSSVTGHHKKKSTIGIRRDMRILTPSGFQRINVESALHYC